MNVKRQGWFQRTGSHHSSPQLTVLHLRELEKAWLRYGAIVICTALLPEREHDVQERQGITRAAAIQRS